MVTLARESPALERGTVPCSNHGSRLLEELRTYRNSYRGSSTLKPDSSDVGCGLDRNPEIPSAAASRRSSRRATEF